MQSLGLAAERDIVRGGHDDGHAEGDGDEHEDQTRQQEPLGGRA